MSESDKLWLDAARSNIVTPGRKASVYAIAGVVQELRGRAPIPRADLAIVLLAVAAELALQENLSLAGFHAVADSQWSSVRDFGGPLAAVSHLGRPGR